MVASGLGQGRYKISLTEPESRTFSKGYGNQLKAAPTGQI